MQIARNRAHNSCDCFKSRDIALCRLRCELIIPFPTALESKSVHVHSALRIAAERALHHKRSAFLAFFVVESGRVCRVIKQHNGIFDCFLVPRCVVGGFCRFLNAFGYGGIVIRSEKRCEIGHIYDFRHVFQKLTRRHNLIVAVACDKEKRTCRKHCDHERYTHKLSHF